MPYEKYHFISKPSKERHIEKMAVITKLLGVNIAPTNHATVLELGSGTGDNLISMAISYPKSYFVGVDKSKSQTETGNKNIEKLGLQNISLLEHDFSHFKSKIKSFDYIIMHGVFSWVDEKSRNASLKLIKKYLKEDGIAYISFNSFPGAIFRDLLIKILLDSDDKTSSIKERIKKVKDNLDSLEESFQDSQSAYAEGMKNEITEIRKLSTSFLINEILNSDYKSFSLEEFCSYIEKFKLYYLSDASFIHIFSENSKDEYLKENILKKIESHIDYIMPKITRGVLITSKKISLKLNLDILDDLYISSPLCYTGGTDSYGEFTTPIGKKFEFDKKEEIDFFKTLEKSWPKPILLKSLCPIIRKKKILDYFSKEFVEFYTRDLNFSNSLSQTPLVSQFAKIQLEKQNFATNFRNEYIIFNDFQKKVFNLLDGKHSKDDILTILINELKENGTFKEDLLKDLDYEINKTLDLFKETAYLV